MICSYSNSAFDHDLDILDESRFLDLTIGIRARLALDLVIYKGDDDYIIMVMITAVRSGYFLIPTDGFLLTHTVPADLLYTDFFGRFWFLMDEFDVTCDHSMEPIGSEVYRRALLEGKSSAYSYLS
ncbi:hypothetical protein Tco_1014468 [Tanacetum coccineum]